MTRVKITGSIHHIEIYVKSIIKTKEFWQWFLKELGYTDFQSWNSGFSMLLGDTYIVFVQTEDQYNNIDFHRCRSGLNHIAFHIDDVKMIEMLKGKLVAKNIQLLYMDKYPHAGGKDTHNLYFEDINRLKVELCCNI